MKIQSLSDLYLDQLQDMHSCERQLVKALPGLAKQAISPEAKAAFKAHLEVTRAQVDRLNSILGDLGKSPGRKVCEATVGLLKETHELLESVTEDSVRDAALLGAAQKIEHYEIATYEGLVVLAGAVGRPEDVKLLEVSIQEENESREALQSLGTVALGAVTTS